MSAALTSVGYVSPAGVGRPGFAARLASGPTAAGTLATYDPEGRLGKRGTAFLSAATKLFCSVSMQALAGAAVPEGRDRIGVYHGAELPNLADDFAFDLVAKHEGPDCASPMRAPGTLANVASGQLAIGCDLRGPNVAVSAGACGALAAIDLALLQLGEEALDVAIVGSVEVTSPYHDALWAAERGHDGLARAGEGGVALVLDRRAGAAAPLAIVERAQGRLVLDDERREDVAVELLAAAGPLAAGDGHAIILGAGADLLDAGRLRDALLGRAGGRAVAPLVPGEALYGRSESMGGALALLLALSMFEDEAFAIIPLAPALLAAFGAEVGLPRALRSATVLCIDANGPCQAVSLRRAP